MVYCVDRDSSSCTAALYGGPEVSSPDPSCSLSITPKSLGGLSFFMVIMYAKAVSLGRFPSLQNQIKFQNYSAYMNIIMVIQKLRKLCAFSTLVQLKLVNSNSLNSNFRITRVFLPVPTFFLHKVTKVTSDNSRSDNSRFRLT